MHIFHSSFPWEGGLAVGLGALGGSTDFPHFPPPRVRIRHPSQAVSSKLGPRMSPKVKLTTLTPTEHLGWVLGHMYVRRTQHDAQEGKADGGGPVSATIRSDSRVLDHRWCRRVLGGTETTSPSPSLGTCCCCCRVPGNTPIRCACLVPGPGSAASEARE